MALSLREELQALMDRLACAYRAGDAASCADLFMASAEIYSPYAPPARGYAEIKALHAEWTQGDTDDKQLTVIDSGGSDSCAWCLVRYSEADGAIAGTSLNICERQLDSTWLIRVSSLNAA